MPRCRTRHWRGARQHGMVHRLPKYTGWKAQESGGERTKRRLIQASTCRAERLKPGEQRREPDCNCNPMCIVDRDDRDMSSCCAAGCTAQDTRQPRTLLHSIHKQTSGTHSRQMANAPKELEGTEAPPPTLSPGMAPSGSVAARTPPSAPSEATPREVQVRQGVECARTVLSMTGGAGAKGGEPEDTGADRRVEEGKGTSGDEGTKTERTYEELEGVRGRGARRGRRRRPRSG